MPIATRFGTLAAILAVVASAALAAANPAAAKEHKIYNDKQAWLQVDQNRDGAISKSEWKWAEKHGYDRLNGVPKKHLTRAEYQRYLNEYLSRRSTRSNMAWHNDQNGTSQHGWDDGRGQTDDRPFIRRTEGGRDHDRD